MLEPGPTIYSCEDLKVSSLAKNIETIMTWNAVLVFGRSTNELELFHSPVTSFDTCRKVYRTLQTNQQSPSFEESNNSGTEE